ncbi:hypothetical protein CDD83_7751 [Cordyceps sp. RAO-2017]|nr:hypothetical protein CDD83_7751 [Cordyceps sp. RAO-2017]
MHPHSTSPPRRGTDSSCSASRPEAVRGRPLRRPPPAAANSRGGGQRAGGSGAQTHPCKSNPGTEPTFSPPSSFPAVDGTANFASTSCSSPATSRLYGALLDGRLREAVVHDGFEPGWTALAALWPPPTWTPPLPCRRRACECGLRWWRRTPWPSLEQQPGAPSADERPKKNCPSFSFSSSTSSSSSSLALAPAPAQGLSIIISSSISSASFSSIATPPAALSRRPPTAPSHLSPSLPPSLSSSPLLRLPAPGSQRFPPWLRAGPRAGLAPRGWASGLAGWGRAGCLRQHESGLRPS